MDIHPFRRSHTTAARAPSSRVVHVVALAGVAALAGCKKDLCTDDSLCPSGFVCRHAGGQTAGELGRCMLPCGEEFCGVGEVCVRTRAVLWTLECRKSCTEDDDCAPAGLCVLSSVSDTSMVGACAQCPECEGDRLCAKPRVDYDPDLYCNARGQDCASRQDTDGDGVGGCFDVDCFGSPLCDSCGDYSLDPGESCDGPAVAVDCSQLDPEYLPTSSPRCGARCFYDPSSCEPRGAVCGTCDTHNVVGSVECEPWITPAGLPVGQARGVAMQYRSGAFWVAWRSDAGVESARYWPGGNLSPAGAVSPPGTVTGDPALGFDEAERPVVAYMVDTLESSRLHAARYADGEWSAFGVPGTSESDGLVEIPSGGHGEALAVAPTGVWLVSVRENRAWHTWFVSSTGVVEYPVFERGGVKSTTMVLTVAEGVNEPFLAVGFLGIDAGSSIFHLVGGSWTELPLFACGYDLTLSWDGGVLAATWYRHVLGGQALQTQSPTGEWTAPPGWNSVVAPVGNGVIASHGGMPVVAWGTYSPGSLGLSAYEGETRGWRRFAGTDCPGSPIDADASGPPALAVGMDGNTPLACLAYEATTAAGHELRVRCHHLRQ